MMVSILTLFEDFLAKLGYFSKLYSLGLRFFASLAIDSLLW